jgi:hypothetical protein
MTLEGSITGVFCGRVELELEVCIIDIVNLCSGGPGGQDPKCWEADNSMIVGGWTLSAFSLQTDLGGQYPWSIRLNFIRFCLFLLAGP